MIACSFGPVFTQTPVLWKAVPLVPFSSKKINGLKRKRKRSDSVLLQKPLQPQKPPKSNMTTHKRHKKLRLHNDCGPSEDGIH